MRIVAAAVAASLLLFGAAGARAADTPPTTDPDPWRIGVTAYLWATNISGSASGICTRHNS